MLKWLEQIDSLFGRVFNIMAFVRTVACIIFLIFAMKGILG